MKAVRMVAVGRPLELFDVPVPRIGDRDVLVRVKAAGICHSDVHYRAGTSPVRPLPMTLGHEVAGVVEEVGRIGAGPAAARRPGGPALQHHLRRLLVLQHRQRAVLPDRADAGPLHRRRLRGVRRRSRPQRAPPPARDRLRGGSDADVRFGDRRSTRCASPGSGRGSGPRSSASEASACPPSSSPGRSAPSRSSPSIAVPRSWRWRRATARSPSTPRASTRWPRSGRRPAGAESTSPSR